MSANYQIQNQNNNKCPHGFPIGTCPICSGMGGAPKDRNKPRRAGEMSYNECMAAWHKIQAAQKAKVQDKLDKIEAQNQKRLLDKIIQGLDKAKETLNTFEKKLDALPNIAKIPAKIILNIIIKPIFNIIAKLPNIITFIQNVITNITQAINSVAEKLSSLLGEIKNFIQEKITKKFKKTIKTILTLFSQSAQDEEEKEIVEKLKAREIKKIIKEMFRTKKERNEHDITVTSEKD